MQTRHYTQHTYTETDIKNLIRNDLERLGYGRHPIADVTVYTAGPDGKPKITGMVKVAVDT